MTYTWKDCNDYFNLEIVEMDVEEFTFSMWKGLPVVRFVFEKSLSGRPVSCRVELTGRFLPSMSIRGTRLLR